MTLNTVVLNEPSGSTVDGGLTPVVLLHGFTQNAQCWGGFSRALHQHMPDRTVIAVDAPGHGRSDHDDADLVATADLLVDTLESHGVDRAVWLGYSMGGRTGLHLAVFRPRRVAGLILVGASPGLADPNERRTRRMADERLADQLLIDGLDVFLDRWLASPLFAGLSPEAAAREARMINRPAGLAASLRNCGTGVQENLWPRLVQVRCPTLLVHGAADEKFARIAHRMAAELERSDGPTGDGNEIGDQDDHGTDPDLPEVDVVAVDGTHAVHLERPDEVAAEVAGFLRRHRL